MIKITYEEIKERGRKNEELFNKIINLEEIEYEKQREIKEEEEYKLHLIEEKINKLNKEYEAENEIIQNWEEDE